MKILINPHATPKGYGLMHTDETLHVITKCCYSNVEPYLLGYRCTDCGKAISHKEINDGRGGAPYTYWASDIPLTIVVKMDADRFKEWSRAWTGIEGLEIRVELGDE